MPLCTCNVLAGYPMGATKSGAFGLKQDFLVYSVTQPLALQARVEPPQRDTVQLTLHPVTAEHPDVSFQAVAHDEHGDLIIADFAGHLLRKVKQATGGQHSSSSLCFRFFWFQLVWF